MKKKMIIAFSIGCLSIGALSLLGYASASQDDMAEIKEPPYEVNEKGQTYGSAMDNSLLFGNPDLVLAEAIDGTRGYVYASELNADQAGSPEELIAIVEENKKIWEEAPVGQVVVSRYIPLYESDGETVIGEFPITIGFKKDATDECPGSLCLK